MKKDVAILGIIPARGGSKGLHKKNIASLCGRPLIYYAIRAAKESKLLDACIVSTDDHEIAEVARSYGADVPFLRPKKYAGDLSRDIDYLRHALDWVEKHRGWTPKIIVMLQPPAPQRTGQDIDDVVRFMRRVGADSVRTVIDPGHYNPFKMFVQTNGKRGPIKELIDLTPYKRLYSKVAIPRQLLPRYFLPDGLVYTTSTHLIRKGKVWGPRFRIYPVDHKRFIDIDTPEDLATAEEKMKRLGLA